MVNPFVPNQVHIRNVLIFLFLSDVKPPETQRQLAAVYQESVPNVRTVVRWNHRFKEGNYSIEDKPRSYRPRELILDLQKATIEDYP